MGEGADSGCPRSTEVGCRRVWKLRDYIWQNGAEKKTGSLYITAGPRRRKNISDRSKGSEEAHKDISLNVLVIARLQGSVMMSEADEGSCSAVNV